ncbi:uncharacterized protein isoform X2 [Rhodnius prolixus]|uniref:uncharacterized protein isoform X2 n=1 Tax=Rhodnius prolixus TaxID=13249 RepID=UPI003D1882AD
MDHDIEEVLSELKSLDEGLHGKCLETLDAQRLSQLLDTITGTLNGNSNLNNHEKFGRIIWNLSLAILLKFPNSLNWTLATRLSECFSGVNMDVSGQHSLFRIDIIREATIASKSLPDIPKAFATLLIAMVSQKYLTINDLESHALALLHFEWAKEELIFIEKCLTDIKAMILAKLANEAELQLILDWIAETVAAMVADMEA